MVSNKDIQSFIKGIDNLIIRLKIETFDLIFPIPAMPKEFIEFHEESGQNLLSLRENMITHSKLFMQDLVELREELSEGGFSQKDIDQLERQLNDGPSRKNFVKSLKDMGDALSFLKTKYGEESENVYQEYKRSKKSDA